MKNKDELSQDDVCELLGDSQNSTSYERTKPLSDVK